MVVVDNVDYKFINGFVDVGDLLCCVVIWNEVCNRLMFQLDFFDMVVMNLFGVNWWLDFSGFWYLLYWFSWWCKICFVFEIVGDYLFCVSICGGVNIWVDGVYVVVYEFFVRNIVYDFDVLLLLVVEGLDVVILLEDMVECDISFFFEFIWFGFGVLMFFLEILVNVQELENLMCILCEVWLEKVVFCKFDSLVLMFDMLFDVVVVIEVVVY